MRDPLAPPWWLRWGLVAAAVAVMALVVLLPLGVLLAEAFARGVAVWWAALTDADARSALELTLFVAAWVIPLNAVFGVLAAWAIARFEFPFKRALLALVDLPFAVSPVVAGLCLVLLFSPTWGWLAPLVQHFEVKVIFARPGIVLATLFITFPFVVRELVPLMQQQGADEELAARSLGAGAWTMFAKVTLPKIKWGLLYGVLLCGARAMGEFGAVSVVSGHIRGVTNTLPLHIEILYNEFQPTAAFAVASLLAGLALVTLVVKFWLEARHGAEIAPGHARAHDDGGGSR